MPPLNTDYPNLRQHLHPDLAGRSDKSIVAAFQKAGMDAEAAEGFFDDLGKIVKKVAPAVLPVAGTVIGGAFGGPIGASLGGSLGSFAGKAIGGGGGQAPAPASGLGGLLAGGLGSLVGGSPAASQLLQTVMKPETMQAMASMAMGA